MTHEFKDDTSVAFADVDHSKSEVDRAFGKSLGVAQGGWPTIRYFNRQTGYGGKPYKKKTQKRMCDELGDEDTMRTYVLTESGATKCDAVYGTDCDLEELKLINRLWEYPKARVAQELKSTEDRCKRGLTHAECVRSARLMRSVFTSEDI